MEDSRTASFSQKRPNSPDGSTNSSKRRKRDSIEENFLPRDATGSTTLTPDEEAPPERKPTSVRASGAAPSVNWNLGSRATIRTTLGGKTKNHIHQSLKSTTSGISGRTTDAIQQTMIPSTVLGSTHTDTRERLGVVAGEESLEPSSQPAQMMSSTSTQIQPSNPIISKLQNITDSLTRRLVEEGTSIVVTGQIENTEGGARSVKAHERKNQNAQIRSSLQDFIQNVGGDGLLEIVIANVFIARYASSSQATRAMGALMSSSCEMKGCTVIQSIKRFEDFTKIAKRFSSMLKYYPNPNSQKLGEGIYGAFINHLQHLAPKSLICDPKDLPRLPSRPLENQSRRASNCPAEDNTQYRPPSQAITVFLDQVSRQACDDIERRAAIHQTEVAYTDCCISDEVYDALMLALLTQKECNEKNIGTKKHFRSPSRFRNWLEAFCLKLCTSPNDALGKNYMQVAAELGRVELSNLHREGVKDMAYSVTPNMSEKTTLSDAESTLLATAMKQYDVNPTSTGKVGKDEPRDKHLATWTEPPPPTRLFVRPLPFNEGQAEYVALFGGYHTEYIGRASNQRGDLHGFGIVDFATAAEADRATAELEGVSVKKCKISLRPDSGGGKPRHMVVVFGDGTVKLVEFCGRAADNHEDKGETANEEHTSPAELAPREPIKSASTPGVEEGSALVGDDGDFEERRQDGESSKGKDGEVDDLEMADDTDPELVSAQIYNDRSDSPTSESPNDDDEAHDGRSPEPISEDTKDEGSDAMLDEYSQSEGARIFPASETGLQVNMGSHANPSTSSKGPTSVVTARSTILADLSDPDLQLQLKYEFAPNGKASQAEPHQLVTCIICRGKGHMASVCPRLTCHGCGAYNHHPARACPTLRRCQKCRERGHSKADCTSKLACSAKADGITCDLCQDQGHNEEQCSKLWRTFDSDAGPKVKVKHLSVFCYQCGKRGHYGGDCPKGPPGGGAIGGPNIWTLDYVKRCFDLSELDPKCLDRSIYSENKSQGKAGFSVKGRASRDPIVLESDSDNDASNFYRPKVATHKAPREQIRIATNGFTNNPESGSSWTPINRPYDDRAPHQSYPDQDDYYRPAGRPGGHDRRRSPSYENPYPMRDTGNQYRPGPTGIDRWQPPLPREPVPTRGAGRGRGRGGKRGPRPGSTSRRENYRPMPSAAKNARKKHLS